jgi:hypothetical protein
MNTGLTRGKAETGFFEKIFPTQPQITGKTRFLGPMLSPNLPQTILKSY